MKTFILFKINRCVKDIDNVYPINIGPTKHYEAREGIFFPFPHSANSLPLVVTISVSTALLYELIEPIGQTIVSLNP
jgi:hypothetical protein